MFTKSIHLVTLFGFRVRLDLSWLVLALLVVTVTAQGFIGPPFQLTSASAVAIGLFFAFGLLASIVLHELSHSLVARLHGLQIKGITLFLLGGVAEMEEEPDRPMAEFLIAIVGPLSSVVIGAACALAGWGFEAASAPPAVVAIIYDLARLNIVLAVFNMVPAFPLDGGRVLRSVLWGLRGEPLWATRVASFLGQAFGAFLAGVGIILLVTKHAPGAILWILLGWFLWRIAPAPYRALKLKSRLSSATLVSFLDTRPVVVARDAPVSDVVAMLRAHRDDDVLPVSDHGRITGVVAMIVLRSVPQHQQAFTAVGEVATPLPDDALVGAGMTADEAVKRMQRLQLPALLVVEASRLLGIVRWHDLRAFAERA